MSTALFLTLLLLLGFLCQWAAWRLRLPAILLLLAAGITLGPGLGWLDPDAMLGEFLFPMVSMGVALILFEGSLTLRFGEIRGLGPTILRLVSVGALVTMLGLATAAHFLADLAWPVALLFGALTCVTGPTVIMPMLRAVRPNERISNILRWEGIIIDPIGALLAVLVLEALMLGHGNGGWGVFAWTVASGAVVGVAGAWVLATVLRRQWLPEYLHNYGTLAWVLVAYAASDLLAHESGLLAVTVMGMVLANLRGLDVEHILSFKEHLSTLIISMLFIVLAARLQWPGLPMLGTGLLVLAAAMLVVRPLSVLLSTLGGTTTWRERALMAWIAPRGIVAAAISALFALRMEGDDPAAAQTLVSLTFLLIIGTVLVQSATSRPLARWLQVSAPSPRQVLVVGSSPVARAIGQALDKAGFRTLLADEDWSGLAAARLAGLNTFYGNPASEHAERTVDFNAFGWLLAMSTRGEMNTLACVRFRPEFGVGRVLRLRVLAPGEAPRQALAAPIQAPALFSEGLTHGELDKRLAAGWKI
ncbi:MAG TPA: sodium:proton antiporter, partial [Arenimonas sp.]|nr:sodium:proton antiporter [Arenimonas sp.]